MHPLKIHNWDRWQSYRSDRSQPPWIKLHRCVMRNPEWVSLSDAERGQLVSLWLLAADAKGEIPSSANVLQQLCYMDKPPDINKFIELGFIDAKVTSTRRQHDANMTQQTRLDETRLEEKESVVDASVSPLPSKSNGATDGRRRGTRLPADWQPTVEDIAYATKRGFGEQQIGEIADYFSDYWTSIPGSKGVKLSWSATWRNWLRKEDPNKPRAGSGRQTDSFMQAVDRALARRNGGNEV